MLKQGKLNFEEFDPNIVDCFVRHKSEIYKLYSENKLILSENIEEKNVYKFQIHC